MSRRTTRRRASERHPPGSGSRLAAPREPTTPVTAPRNRAAACRGEGREGDEDALRGIRVEAGRGHQAEGNTAVHGHVLPPSLQPVEGEVVDADERGAPGARRGPQDLFEHRPDHPALRNQPCDHGRLGARRVPVGERDVPGSGPARQGLALRAGLIQAFCRGPGFDRNGLCSGEDGRHRRAIAAAVRRRARFMVPPWA